MATIKELLNHKLTEHRRAHLAERELQRINDPDGFAERERAEVLCPLVQVVDELKRIRAPIRAKLEALRGVEEFGGNINRHSCYHLIHKHRRRSSFTPLVQRFLRDFERAQEQDRGLTREAFIGTYSDQLMEFLNGYKLMRSPSLNQARIEGLTLRMLVALVKSQREKYGVQFEKACELEASARQRFFQMQESEARKIFRQWRDSRHVHNT